MAGRDDMARRLFACLASLVLLVLCSSASAGSFPPLFVAADIPVDATAQDTVPARDVARQQGEIKGLRRVLERLTSPKDWSQLPTLDASQATRLVVDFEVLEEHSTAARYVANYIFRFSPKGVRQLLKDAGIPFTEVTSKPVIVVPIWQSSTQSAAQPASDPWREAWTKVPGRFGMVPWVVAPPDQTNGLIPSNGGAPKQEDLTALSQRYDDGDVVVATAVQTNDSHLDITVSRYSADGSVVTDKTSADSTRPGSPLYHAGVAAAVILLENQWKTVNVPVAATSNSSSIEVVVPVSRSEDWGAVRSRLARVDAVQGITIEILTRHNARLALNTSSDEATLRTALAQQDLILGSDDGTATRSLTLRAGAASP
jgi:hypothetical protein